MILRTLLFFVAYTAPALAGFALLAFLTRTLPAAEYATYSLANSISILIASFGLGWLKFGIARYQPGRTREGLSRVIIRGAAASGVPIIIGAAFVVWVGNFATQWIPAIALFAISYGLFECLQEQNKALGFNRRFLSGNVGRSLLGLAFGATAAMLSHEGLATTVGVAAGFASIAVVLAWRQLGVAKEASNDSTWIKPLLRYGLSFSLSGAITMMRPVAAKAIATAALVTTAAGGFAAAYDLAGQMAGALALAVYSAVAPGTFRSNRDLNNEQMKRDLSRAAEFYLFLTAPAVTGMIFVAPEFATLFTGAAFHDEVGRLLPWLMLSAALTNFLAFYLHLSFQIAEKLHLQILTNIVALSSAVIFAWTFVPVYGAPGIVLGLLAGDVIGICAALLLQRFAWPLPLPLAAMARILAATTVMAMALLLLQQEMQTTPLIQLVAKIILGAAAFVTGCVIFDALKVRTQLWPALLTRLGMKRS